MGRLGMVEKVLVFLTALGASLTVVALALFAVNGSGFAPDFLRGVAGSVLGMTTALVLTRSPRRGTRIAALLLLVSLIGFCALLISAVVSPVSAAEVRKGTDGTGFIPNFLGWMIGPSLLRLLGFNLLGPRGARAPPRRP